MCMQKRDESTPNEGLEGNWGEVGAGRVGKQRGVVCVGAVHSADKTKLCAKLS